MDDDFKKMINKLFESNRSLIMEYFEDEVKTKYISRSSAHKILFDTAHIISVVFCVLSFITCENSHHVRSIDY